jgi:branched-chain amino acid transport system substrate-binding protein
LKSLFKILLIIVIASNSLWARPPRRQTELPGDYKMAMSFYEKGDFKDAYNLFAKLTKSYPSDSNNSIYNFMAAKSLYKSGDYKGSSGLWKTYIDSFPGSNLIGEARLFWGHSLYYNKDIKEAAEQYLLTIENDSKSKAAEIAQENVMPLIKHGLTLDELDALISKYPKSPLAETMDYAMAQREIDAGHYRKGNSLLRVYIKRYPGSRNFKQARILLEESAEKSENEILLGLLVPLTGSYQEYGRSMVEGANLAVKGFFNNTTKVSLAIRDTKGNPILAAKVAKTLAEEEPIAVVGPLRSESALSAAIVLNEHSIPMITPTASEQSLSSIGPNIFQISPSIEQIGMSLAKYAIKNLKINEFAIIAPDDNSGSKISNAFTEAVYKLGGEVILTSYYPSGATDFKQQIMPLREILLARSQVAQSISDSLNISDSTSVTVSPDEDRPVQLGGLFLPGYSDDLKLLIPQVKYHVIRTRFLGGDGWDSNGLISEVKQYIDNSVFATDFHIDDTDADWQRFSKSFKQAYNHPPDKVAALTYDAVKIILDGIMNGNKNSDEIRDYLSNIDNYNGVSCNISFKSTGRANDGVMIYEIDGGKLARKK